jgi:cyclin B
MRGRGSRLSRSSLDHAAGSENVPEKQQASIVPTAILGDATNTYSNLGQRPLPPKGDTGCPPKPIAVEQQAKLLTTEGDMNDIAMQPENPQCCAEYVQDIFQVLKREEALQLASPTYMDRQVHVNAKMRAILIDWLVDVHKKYKLRPETLFLAVHLVDRYLEVQVTIQSQLQLVGVTSLMIAAKFEEIYPPQIKEFVNVTDNAYSQKDILKMEVCILKVLKFKICRPTAIHFLERYQRVNGCTDAHRDLAQYLLELTLVEYKMLKYPPSHLAAAAILLSNKLLRRPSWTPAAVRHTKMTEPMLKECAKEMCVMFENAESSSLQAVRKKFSQQKHHAVAKINFTAGPSAIEAAIAREGRGSLPGMGRRSSTGGSGAGMELV